MELLLLALGNNQPVDFAGAVPSIIFTFHHHHLLKYDDLTDLLHDFQLLRKTDPSRVLMKLWRTTDVLMTQFTVSSLQHIGP
jgi:hypothetical protein